MSPLRQLEFGVEMLVRIVSRGADFSVIKIQRVDVVTHPASRLIDANRAVFEHVYISAEDDFYVLFGKPIEKMASIEESTVFVFENYPAIQAADGGSAD